MSNYQSNPSDWTLAQIEEGLLTSEDLLLCCLKFMSNDDVKEMLEKNEFSPSTCDSCDNETDDQYCDDCKIENFIEKIDSTSHDVELLRIDIENENFDIDSDDEDYFSFEEIVKRSIETGQIKQAKEQCKQYNLDFDEIKEELEV